MSRKQARFDVIAIEITVHCPHCESLVQGPRTGGALWDVRDLNYVFFNRGVGSPTDCPSCKRGIKLPQGLRSLLLPSTEPVRTDRRVSSVAQEIICANCAGDEIEPRRTLLTTNQRCATCGGDNYELVNKPNFNNTTEDNHAQQQQNI